MKLQKGYYFVNAMTQPNEIYPLDDLRIESGCDKWGVCDIFGTLSDELKQTVDSISVSERWSDQWEFPYPYKTPTHYRETTTSESPWSISQQFRGTAGTVRTVGTVGTVYRIPVYLSSDTTHHEIKKVIFHNPATIVLWEDGTKTVVKCQEGDTYSKEIGLAMCMLKKYMGNKGNFNEVFKKYCGGNEDEGTVADDKLL